MSSDSDSDGIVLSDYKKKSKSDTVLSQIHNHEKLELIDQTNHLQKIRQAEQTTTSEYIWQAIFLSIPFGFLMATFDMSVKVQYHESWSYNGMFWKCVQSAPVLAPLIYLTNRYKAYPSAQLFMTLGSIISGSFLMYTIFRTSSFSQTMRAPGLATVWIYFIVQLDLLPATLTLVVIGLYWYFGLRIQ